MKYPEKLKKTYEEIQKKIFLMLPENWDKLCLYASVVEQPNQETTGEMFFYYFPKGILRKKPVNVYEVPAKFGIDEKQYLDLAHELYELIKKQRNLCIENSEKPWSNLTILIEKQKFRIIYGYEDLVVGDFNGDEMRIIWRYRYLNESYESFNKKQKEIIEKYEKAVKYPNQEIEMPLYEKGINKKLNKLKTLEENLEFVTEEKIEEMKFISNHIPKSQILNKKIKV